VAGRHRSSAVAGKNPSNALHGPHVVLLSGGVLLSALAGIGVCATGARNDCDGPVPLTVHAAPSIAPVIESVAARLHEDDADPNAKCLDVTVVSRDPVAVAAGLTRETSARTPPTTPAGPPDVWIPDSSLWLAKVRATATGRNATAEAGMPVASSPVVIAVAAPVAEKLGWSARQVSWRDLMKGAPPVALPDPSRSAVGLSSLASLQRAVGTGEQARERLASLIRTRAGHSFGGVPELLTRLPVTPAGIGRATVVAFPADEHAVWDYNGKRPAVPLVSVYPSEGSLWLDYPYVVLTRTATDSVRSAAAATLFGAILDARTRGTLLAAGLRLPDGSGALEQAEERGTRRVAPRSATSPATKEWTGLVRAWS